MFTILTLYCAHNPSTYGALAWEDYPTLRCLLEMCITSQFSFPPPTAIAAAAVAASGGEEAAAEALRVKEAQTATLERASILELERHLAAATNQQNVITEANSLLLAQLTSMDPTGPVRRPPQQFLDQLQQINQVGFTSVLPLSNLIALTNVESFCAYFTFGLTAL